MKFFLKWFAKVWFDASGWKLIGHPPKDQKKFVLVFSPHTSDWDVFYTMGAVQNAGWRIQFLVNKKSFSKGRGPLLRAFGGIPIDKEKNEGVVSKAVQLFRERDEIILVLNPEGGKGKTQQFRTGFYHIAMQAKVPILLAYIDYPKKIVGYGELFYPCGDMKKDFQYIWNYYKDFSGKFPEKGITGTLVFDETKGIKN